MAHIPLTEIKLPAFCRTDYRASRVWRCILPGFTDERFCVPNFFRRIPRVKFVKQVQHHRKIIALRPVFRIRIVLDGNKADVAVSEFNITTMDKDTKAVLMCR